MNAIHYFMKKPGRVRRTFALVAYRLEGRKKIYVPLSKEITQEVAQINHQFLNNALTFGQTTSLLKGVIERESSVADRISRLIVNHDLFEAFWNDVYSTRYLDDPCSPKYGFLKALRTIEPMSIQSASQAELQHQLRTKLGTNAEIRRATGYINQLLKYLKRDIRLNKPKPGLTQVNYCTKDELITICQHLSTPDINDLVVILFASGLRLSEALALTPGDYHNNEVSVTKQLSKAGLKLPKARKTGKSWVMPFGHEPMLRWVQVKDKEQYRYKLYDDLVSASVRSIGRDISPHDLRHSHAIHLLGQGANLTQVALNLRNRIDVCQNFYTGFAHTDATLDGLKKAVKV